MELWQYDATDLARLIRTGQASAREAVDSVLARLDKVNPAINAVVRTLHEEARAAAETADAARARGHALGTLHGVPITIKINIDVAGQPTDNGVKPLKDFVAQEDSPVAANFRHAGAITIGRTNAPAFSMRIYSDNALHGRTLNPLDPTVTPGGSSGGAGAAAATGIGAIAHGNDIGGSVRIPAYCNGVVGLRTGFARIPSFNPTAAKAGRAVGAVIMAVQFIAASTGYLRQWDRIPPPLFQVVIWTLLVTVIFSRSKPAAAIAQRTCWPVLIATQAFRLPLELTMHHAASTGVMPVQMSYSGLNFDILTGLSAIVLSAALAFGRAGRTAIRIWNILGFLLLVNVVAIAIASLPLFHAFGPEKLNTWVTYPPFIWLPGLLVPAALLGHLLVWRKLSNL